MSTPTPPAAWDFVAYHETPEHAALRGEQTPPPEPISVAREHLAAAALRDAHEIDFSSIKEESKRAVIVDDNGEWEEVAPGQTPTGHIVHWSCTGWPQPERTDEDMEFPLVEGEPGRVVAKVPERVAIEGGGGRIQHDLNSAVTVSAFREDGEPIGYQFFSEVDANSVHMELVPGAATVVVTAEE